MTSTISGQSTLSCSVKRSLWFTVFLSGVASPRGLVIPQSSVAGRMAGSFDAQVWTPTMQVNGKGTAEWTIRGTHDPATETVSIAIRSSGVDYKGTDTYLGEFPESRCR